MSLEVTELQTPAFTVTAYSLMCPLYPTVVGVTLIAFIGSSASFFLPDSLYSFTKITVSVSKLFQGCNLQQGFHHLHLSTEVSECCGEIVKIIANLFQTSVA